MLQHIRTVVDIRGMGAHNINDIFFGICFKYIISKSGFYKKGLGDQMRILSYIIWIHRFAAKVIYKSYILVNSTGNTQPNDSSMDHSPGHHLDGLS